VSYDAISSVKVGALIIVVGLLAGCRATGGDLGRRGSRTIGQSPSEKGYGDVASQILASLESVQKKEDMLRRLSKLHKGHLEQMPQLDIAPHLRNERDLLAILVARETLLEKRSHELWRRLMKEGIPHHGVPVEMSLSHTNSEAYGVDVWYAAQSSDLTVEMPYVDDVPLEEVFLVVASAGQHLRVPIASKNEDGRLRISLSIDYKTIASAVLHLRFKKGTSFVIPFREFISVDNDSVSKELKAIEPAGQTLDAE
jgi:hypothetical protein